MKDDTYLGGSDSDAIKAAKKNADLFQASKFNSGQTTARLIGYNRRLKMALIELIEGEVFTSGWHVVIKQEDNRWRLMMDTNIGVH